MTYSATVFANANFTALSAFERPGFTTPVDLTSDRNWWPEDCAAPSEHLTGTTRVYYVEAVCLDLEFVDGGFEMELFDTCEAAQATLGGEEVINTFDDYCNEAVQVYVTKVA